MAMLSCDLREVSGRWSRDAIRLDSLWRKHNMESGEQSVVFSASQFDCRCITCGVGKATCSGTSRDSWWNLDLLEMRVCFTTSDAWSDNNEQTSLFLNLKTKAFAPKLVEAEGRLRFSLGCDPAFQCRMSASFTNSLRKVDEI